MPYFHLMRTLTHEIISNRIQTTVNKAIEHKALQYLNTLAAGHSKSEILVKKKLRKIREVYFEDCTFSKSG